MKTTFRGKTSSEKINEVFDFENQLASSETISTASVTATVYSGTDASPSAIVSGSASISGAQVTQKIVDGTEGVVYLLTCTVTTSAGQTLSLGGFLPVIPISA